MTYDAVLNFLTQQEYIGLLDRHFANFIARLTKGSPLQTTFVLAGALASRAAGRDSEYGMCVPVSALNSMTDLAEYLHIPPEEIPPELTTCHWQKLEELPPVLSTNQNTLLILAHGMVYLNGVYKGEQRILQFIRQRLSSAGQETCSIDPKQLTKLPLKEEQVIAIQHAVNSKFHIISGGPGTGKTTIIALLLALRKEIHDAATNICLCAPTGKAQSRMKEAILEELEKFTSAVPDDVKKRIAALPCSTIHRLLHNNPDTNSFLYNKDNKLSCDLLIVDECSMISERLMTSLLDALPDHASVIMLGDKAQLSSVEPGSVFADFMDICATAENALSKLKSSVRFDPELGIGKLKDLLESPAKNIGAQAWECLCNNPPQLLQRDLPKEQELSGLLRELISNQESGGWLDATGKKAWYDVDDLDTAWEQFDSLRILSPVHNGMAGTDNLNKTIRTLLKFPSAPVKAGMAFLILKNTPELDVFNGDVGMLWYGIDPMHPCRKDDPDCSGLFVYFPAIDENGKRIWRGIPPQYLPEYDDAYAISVHKSQGSGYSKILFFLPAMQDEKHSDLLTKELIYTGVTRAKKQTVLIGNKTVFSAAAELASPRSGGLYSAFLASGQVNCLDIQKK